MKAELIPAEGGDPIPITKDVTVVGRREYCDIQVDDPSLSRRHCVLVKTDGLLVIRDLATTNGTKVKGQKVRWAALLPDDKISLGGVKFRIYLGPDDIPSPSERLARGESTLPEARKPFASPTPYPAMPAPVPSPAKPATRPSAARDDDEFDPPLLLDVAAWRDAMDSAEDEEIIELD